VHTESKHHTPADLQVTVQFRNKRIQSVKAQIYCSNCRLQLECQMICNLVYATFKHWSIWRSP